MEGAFAILGATLAFVVPLAIPLFVQGWRGFLVVLALGTAVATWLTLEMPVPGSIPNSLGTFLGGLIVVGLALGVIAKFVMLVARRPASQDN